MVAPLPGSAPAVAENCGASPYHNLCSTRKLALFRAVPSALVLLGGGSAGAWALWSSVGSALLAALLSIVAFGVWGGLVYYFVKQTPDMGEISVTNWFLIRAVRIFPETFPAATDLESLFLFPDQTEEAGI